MYEWLSGYQQSLVLDLSTSSSAFELSYSLVVTFFVSLIDLFFVFFILIFGDKSAVNSIAYLDIKIIILSIILGGFIYRAFSDDVKSKISVLLWLVTRFVSFFNATLTTLLAITFFTRSAVQAGAVLDKSLTLSLNDYTGAFVLLIAGLALLCFSKGVSMKFYYIQRNSLGRKV